MKNNFKYDICLNGSIRAIKVFTDKNSQPRMKLGFERGGVVVVSIEDFQTGYANGISPMTAVFSDGKDYPEIFNMLESLCPNLDEDVLREMELQYEAEEESDSEWCFRYSTFDAHILSSDEEAFNMMCAETALDEEAEDPDLANKEHLKRKQRRSQRRKNTFRAGTRRQRIYNIHGDDFSGSLRDCCNKGRFQEGEEHKEVYGKYTNSKKCKSAKVLRQLESAADQDLFETDEQESSYTYREWDFSYNRYWNDWRWLRKRIQEHTGLSDKEMSDISCTEILYLSATFFGDVSMPAANGWEPEKKRFSEDWEYIGNDPDALVPCFLMGSACKHASDLLSDSWSESLLGC